MTETTSINAISKNVGVKPRLSLLSSRQSRARLNSSEDSPTGLAANQLLESRTHADGLLGGQMSEIPNMTEKNDSLAASQSASMPVSSPDLKETSSQSQRIDEFESSVGVSNRRKLVQEQKNEHQQQRVGFDKLSVTKEDLIALLSMLKSELQSKEMALASMKLEQLKRLINPVEISRSSLAKTYIELQDRLKAKEQLNENGRKFIQANNSANSSASEEIAKVNEERNNGLTSLDQYGGTTSVNKHDGNINYSNDDSDDETIEIFSTLLELLDRHPLLALPRDSLYCLDYNCNEVSTKNYLNLKIQHLEDLIAQHRKFRHHIKERLKRSEERSLDLTIKLELERKCRRENERSVFKNNGRAVLMGHIDQLKGDLEREKASKQAIVMTLLNELLDERERNELLSERVNELEGRLRAGGIQGQQQQGSSASSTIGAQQQQQQSVCKPRVPAKPAQLFFASASRNQK